MKLSPAQVRMLAAIDRMPCSTPFVGFKSDPTVKALLARGLVTFTPTAFGAGYIRRPVRSRLRPAA